MNRIPQDIEQPKYILNSSEEEKRARRRKKRKRNRALTVAGLCGSLILLTAVMYLGLWVWDSQRQKAADAMADGTQMVYTKEELDSMLAQAQTLAKEQAQLAAEAREEEILGQLRQNFENGDSTVEALRPFYPGRIVLASNGSIHFVPIREELKKHSYEIDNLSILESGEHQYIVDEQVTSHKGIDVSKHQGKIDWQKVAGDGVEFAFIRVALRGYGEAGTLMEDEFFEENIKGALAAGIKVGVYIYSQAITEEELQEEAALVLESIAPYKIECPVVYDVERVAGAEGRMNNLSVEERTNQALLFCQTIEQAGYKPMIYHNMEMGVMMLDLGALEQYDKWFAYYNDDFYYPYDFAVWQYTEKGQVNGVSGDVDLNISFGPLWEE